MAYKDRPDNAARLYIEDCLAITEYLVDENTTQPSHGMPDRRAEEIGDMACKIVDRIYSNTEIKYPQEG